jgi:hypothetical protein
MFVAPVPDEAGVAADCVCCGSGGSLNQGEQVLRSHGRGGLMNTCGSNMASGRDTESRRELSEPRFVPAERIYRTSVLHVLAVGYLAIAANFGAADAAASSIRGQQLANSAVEELHDVSGVPAVGATVAVDQTERDRLSVRDIVAPLPGFHFPAAVDTTIPLGLNLTGTFSGTDSDGTMSLVLTQTGNSLSGHGSASLAYPYPEVDFIVTGTVNGTTVTLAMQSNGGCYYDFLGESVTSATNDRIEGSFFAPLVCSGDYAFQHFVVTRGGQNPAPSISSVSPSSVTAGGAGFALTVDGSGFVSASLVYWNGGQRQTSYVSSGELTAMINAGDIASQGSATVTVVNPGPGGGTSGGVTVAIQPSGGHCTPTAVGSCPFTVNRSLTTSSCTAGKRGSDNYTDVFSFAGTQGANVVIDLSSLFDTYLYLVAPDGSIFAVNDDSNGTFNSEILATLNVAGTWTVEATSFAQGVTGSYTLSLSGCGGGSLATPTGLVVTYNHALPGVNLSWNGVANAVDYEGEINGSQVLDLQTSGTTKGVVGLGEPVCYSIRVRAVDALGQRSGWSARDIATSVIFSNDPLTSGSTLVKAAHFNELRAAVATVRASAGLSSFSYSNAIAPGTTVRAIDTIELRNALNGALSALGLPSVVFSDPVAHVSIIQASDLQRLRNAMK